MHLVAGPVLEDGAIDDILLSKHDFYPDRASIIPAGNTKIPSTFFQILHNAGINYLAIDLGVYSEWAQINLARCLLTAARASKVDVGFYGINVDIFSEPQIFRGRTYATHDDAMKKDNPIEPEGYIFF